MNEWMIMRSSNLIRIELMHMQTIKRWNDNEIWSHNTRTCTMNWNVFACGCVVAFNNHMIVCMYFLYFYVLYSWIDFNSFADSKLKYTVDCGETVFFFEISMNPFEIFINHLENHIFTIFLCQLNVHRYIRKRTQIEENAPFWNWNTLI